MNPTDDRAEHQLDTWLATARAAFDNALDDMLDLDAGLADARLPGRHAALTRALDDVVDIEAGLDQILPNHHPRPSSTNRSPEPSTRQTALAAFADRFAVLPFAERLTARTWLPQQELIPLRSLTSPVFIYQLGTAHAALANAGVVALTRARAITRQGDLGRQLDLDHVLTRARALAVDVRHGRAVTLASELAHDLAFARDVADGLDLPKGRALALVVDLVHALIRDIHLGLGLRYEPDGDPFARELLRAVDGLESATTDVTKADLSQVDLSGIPLEGLRWSSHTRWPEGWQDTIQSSSIEIGRDLYEIRRGGVNIDRAVDTPT